MGAPIAMASRTEVANALRISPVSNSRLITDVLWLTFTHVSGKILFRLPLNRFETKIALNQESETTLQILIACENVFKIQTGF